MSGFDFSGLAAGMREYHKKHVEYDQAFGIADALSRIGVDESGRLVPMGSPDADGKKQKLNPLIDPRVMQQLTTQFKGKREAATGALEALTRLGLGTAQRAIAQKMEDASVSGQRTQQIMKQDETMFPLDVEQKKAQTAHLKKITDEEGKVNVPGFGLMTPSQYSAHLSRQERMDVLKKKSEPILQFENKLKNAYGLGIQDFIDASQPQEFVGGDKKKYKGTPYYDENGVQVDSQTAGQNPTKTYVKVGPNQTLIPLRDDEGGLGWKQLLPVAKNFKTEWDTIKEDQTNLSKAHEEQQAQQVIAILKGKDESQLTPEEQAALAKAKSILGQ